MKILRTIIILVSLLLITSLVNVKEVRAEEVKKDNSNSIINKQVFDDPAEEEWNPFKEYYLLKKYSKFIKKREKSRETIYPRDSEEAKIVYNLSGYNIYTDTGKIIELVNITDKDKYFLKDYIKDIGYFVFYKVDWSQSYSYILVSKHSGEIYNVIGDNIIFSPNKAMMISYYKSTLTNEHDGGDEESSQDSFLFEICKVLPEKVIKERDIYGKNQQINSISWIKVNSALLSVKSDKGVESKILYYDNEKKDWLLKEIKEKLPNFLKQSFYSSDEKKEMEELIANKNIAIEFIKYHTIRLDYGMEQVLKKFKNDKEVVKVAVENHGSALQYASDNLKDDREVVKIAVKSYGMSLEYASNRLKDDKEIVKIALKNGYDFLPGGLSVFALKYASSRLKDNEEIISFAINQKYGSNDELCNYVSPRIKNDKNFIRNELRNGNRNILNCTSDKIKSEFSIDKVTTDKTIKK